MSPDFATACGGASCCGRSSETGPTSRWRDFDGYARRNQQSLWPQTSTLGVHVAVGQVLEELQLHVATEVKRVQVLLSLREPWRQGPLAAPNGDSAPMESDYLTSQARHWAPEVSETKASDAEGAKASARGRNTPSDRGRNSPDRGRNSPSGSLGARSSEKPFMTRWNSCLSEQQENRARLSCDFWEHQGVSSTETLTPEWPLRRQLRQLVESHYFEVFWISAVMINSALIGVQTQWAALHIGKEEPLALKVVQHCFTVLFAVELGLRIAGLGCQRLLRGDSKAWAILDLFVVVVSFVEVAIDIIRATTDEHDVGTQAFLHRVRTIRIVRFARFLRGFRVERLLHLISGLRTLVFSIVATLRSLMWALLLLFLIIYMVGVMLTQAVVDYLADGDEHGLLDAGIESYWRSVDVTMFTLFQSISGGISWHDSAVTLGKVSIVLVWIFTAYVAFTYFAVMNVVTGVFCNSAIEAAARNPDVVAQNLINNRKVYVENLERLFDRADEDENVVITFKEFEAVLADPQHRAFLAALEIEGTDAWTLFKLIDTDRDGIIQKHEFIQGCLQLKGVARNVDLMNLNREVSRFERKLGRFMSKLEELHGLIRSSTKGGRPDRK